MADPRQPGGPVRPEPPPSAPDRLRRWFAAEVRAAERDVNRGLVTVPGTWVRRGVLGRRGFAGGAVAATGVVVLLVAALTSGFLGGTVGPSASGGSGQPKAGHLAVVMGLYGLPSSIDGEPVLTVAQTLVHVPQTTDETPFLVGGIFRPKGAIRCPVQINPEPSTAARLVVCGGEGLNDPSAAGGLWVAMTGDMRAIQADSPVVVRVHTHDPAAADCPASWTNQCEEAVVVESVAWTATVASGPTTAPSGALFADGIPSTFDGQPVLRPTQAAARAAASTDASTFLIGGWVTGWFPFPYSSCPQPTGSEADQVLDQGPCGVYLAESPVIDQTGPVKLHFQVGLSDGRYSGPVIVRVHTHDPLATSCTDANQDACAHAVVVDALLWDGPALGPDGLPSWIDGQTTISVPEALDALARSSSATELFVRGWYSGFALPCPFIPATVPPTPGSSLLPDDCTPSILGQAPIPLGQDHATSTDLNLTLGPGVDAPPIGEVVLEVHGHDPTAAACDPSIRAACEAAVIVDRVVWTASTGIVSPAPTITPVPSPVDVPSSIGPAPSR